MKNLFVKSKKEILRYAQNDKRKRFRMTSPSCHCEADEVSRSNLVEG